MSNIIDWLLESNRLKHFLGGFFLGLCLTFFCALGCGAGMEFKDEQWGGYWDWVDFALTCLGGLIGQAFQILCIYLILK